MRVAFRYAFVFFIYRHHSVGFPTARFVEMQSISPRFVSSDPCVGWGSKHLSPPYFTRILQMTLRGRLFAILGERDTLLFRFRGRLPKACLVNLDWALPIKPSGIQKSTGTC